MAPQATGAVLAIRTSGASPAASSQPAPAPAPAPYPIYDAVTPQLIPAGPNVAPYATGAVLAIRFSAAE